MAFSRIALFLAISMVLFSSVAMATDYNVGDQSGWTLDFNYTQWAQDKVFRVGDNLVFNYNNSRHNVFKLNATQFQNCSFPPSNSNNSLSTGNDVIQLKLEGKKWYACGVANHCSDHQMKLVINVVSEGPAPAPSSAVVSSLSGVLMVAIVAISAFFA
ncbi:blue copper protein 1a-like [Gastrolobium bilobum]|uniref:blue copper protein 1a-like n=1 Tax=Gastrolobium bilobum TaxID=150636 RepID=UPI002AB033C3|nr:blue copper protein 1a-like [Gastrolobium bilobum]